MSTGHPPEEGTKLFPPAFAGGTGSVDAATLWTVLRRAMAGGISPESTWLVRWTKPAMPTGGGPARDDDGARARDVVQAVRAQSPTGTVCLRYDVAAVLVLAGDAGWAGPHAAIAASGLADEIEVWRAVAVSDDGLRFRRVATDSRSAPTDAPAASDKRGTSKLVLSDAEYTFFPLWDIAANQVFAYLCRAAWTGPGSEPLAESSPEIRGAAPERLAAIDLALFRAGTAFVQDALDNYGSVDVVIPVHCGIFSSPRAIAGLFDTVGREIWPVLENVYFELIPETAPASFRNVDAAVGQLASYGRRVMLRVDADDDLSSVPTADWLSVGFEPSSSANDGDAAALGEFARRVRELGYAAHVFGLTGTPATVGAVNAGFAYVGSDAIASPLTGEEDAQAQPADILKAILASRSAR